MGREGEHREVDRGGAGVGIRGAGRNLGGVGAGRGPGEEAGRSLEEAEVNLKTGTD